MRGRGQEEEDERMTARGWGREKKWWTQDIIWKMSGRGWEGEEERMKKREEVVNSRWEEEDGRMMTRGREEEDERKTTGEKTTGGKRTWRRGSGEEMEEEWKRMRIGKRRGWVEEDEKIRTSGRGREKKWWTLEVIWVLRWRNWRQMLSPIHIFFLSLAQALKLRNPHSLASKTNK